VTLLSYSEFLSQIISGLSVLCRCIPNSYEQRQSLLPQLLAGWIFQIPKARSWFLPRAESVVKQAAL
jgi:hypothetical protein